MTIKPIDLQTNIGQLDKIAKGEQGRSAAAVENQHVLEKDSGVKGKQRSERLDENKKAEKTAIKREEEEKKRRKKKEKREALAKEKAKSLKTEEKEKEKKVLPDDEKVGRLIDIKR